MLTWQVKRQSIFLYISHVSLSCYTDLIINLLTADVQSVSHDSKGHLDVQASTTADCSAVYLPCDSAEFTPSSQIPALLQKTRHILQTRTWWFPEEARELKVVWYWRVNLVVISLWCPTAQWKCGKTLNEQQLLNDYCIPLWVKM